MKIQVSLFSLVGMHIIDYISVFMSIEVSLNLMVEFDGGMFT